jgi:hypothetical protein
VKKASILDFCFEVSLKQKKSFFKKKLKKRDKQSKMVFLREHHPGILEKIPKIQKSKNLKIWAFYLCFNRVATFSEV